MIPRMKSLADQCRFLRGGDFVCVQCECVCGASVKLLISEDHAAWHKSQRQGSELTDGAREISWRAPGNDN